MLSFINMGNRKKRPRKKSIKVVSGAAIRAHKRASRGSGSFMSPGSLGDAVEKGATRPHTIAGASGRKGGSEKKADTSSASPQTPGVSKRSPQIQVEFKHDSLLQSLPEDFLRHSRKGSAASSADDVGAAGPQFSQAATRSSNLEGSPREKGRRMPPIPSLTPIKIPASPLQSISAKSRRRSSQLRRSFTTNSPAWASDSEVSPVSGLSAARDVLAESFSFSFRGNAFGDPSSKEKEMSIRIARQDSATLPKDSVWEGAVRSPSVSRRSSAHSMKKRKRDTTTATLPPFEPFVLPASFLRRDEANVNTIPESNSKQQISVSAPPRSDSIRMHVRNGSMLKGPPPPGLTPSAQKLDQVDQAGLHRISLIVETDREASSASLTPPVSGSTPNSFSSGTRMDSSRTTEGSVFGSPLKIPSALSTPSTYSQYTVSPYASPGRLPKSAGTKSGKSSKSEGGNESFLEDFDFVGPSSGSSSRGRNSGYSGSGDSPFGAQLPTTATSTAFIGSPKPTSATGSLGFPRESPKILPSRPTNSSTNTNVKHENPPSSSSYYSPSSNRGSSAGPRQCSPQITRNRNSNGSISSTVAILGRSPRSNSNHQWTALNSNTADNSSGSNKDSSTNVVIAGARAEPSSNVSIKVAVSGPSNSDAEKQRPSRPQLHVVNPSLSASTASPSASPYSGRSPDLLDMLIPNGHVVTPISHRQVGRKRSGSTPSPITIAPHRSMRYLPMNGDDDDDETGNIERRCDRSESVYAPKSTPNTGDAQTFPETPVLFSPDLPTDAVSRSNSGSLPRKGPTTMSLSVFANAMPLQTIDIPSTPHGPETARYPDLSSKANELADIDKKCISLMKDISVSPPISPLQPPTSPVAPVPMVQVLSDAIRPSIPILAPAPRRNTIRIRPPLPFGPRKQNNLAARTTAPLSFAPRRTASESAAVITQARENARSQKQELATLPSTPSFKTTSVQWRGLTLDAAKWTLSSSQLQYIVRSAIEQSAQASAIRLLSPDALKELEPALENLKARRLDIQSDYKVLVRRRRSIIQRLTCLSAGGPRIDTFSIVRDAEELATVTAFGDRLVEELHSVDDQIGQICRIQDVHQSSALAVALRKLNASLFRQTAETQTLQLEVANLHAEKNEAWRKADELERELDMLNDQAGSSRSKSVSSSRRSSRVSLARKNSSRTSKAGLRHSGYSYRRFSQRSSSSSMLVNLASSARSTVTYDMIPPVPPLPINNPPVLSSTGTQLSSRPATSFSQASALPSSDGLYNAVYDLLGTKGSERALPSPFRPRSEIYLSSAPLANDSTQKQNAHPTDAMHLSPPRSEIVTRGRSGSLPTTILQQLEEVEADAIVALLDFHD